MRAIRIPPGYAIAKELGLAWADDIRTLYKFRSFGGESRRWVRDTLKNSRIFCPYPTQFNDPFDVKPIIRHSGDVEDPNYVAALRRRQRKVAELQGRSAQEIADLERQLGATVHALPELVEREIRGALREKTRILCLTADRMHPLQWSHYADSHKGLCLHFWSVYGSVFGQARRVRYTTRRTPLRISPNPIPSLRTAERLAFTKAKFWAYEHEYRLVRPAGLPGVEPLRKGYLYFHPMCFSGVTLGSQMSSKDRRYLIRMAAKYRPQLDIWEAYEDPDQFKLNVRLLGTAATLAVPATSARRRKIPRRHR
jgi:hypothetical protein